MSQDVIVNNGVLSYPHLWTPSVAKGSDTPRWGCSVILPEDFDWAPVQAAIQEAMAVEWPQGAPANLRMPWESVPDGPYAGRWAMKFYRKAEGAIPPEVVMQNPQMKAGPHQAGEFFAGSIVNVWGRAFGYQVGAPGISLYLNAVQLVNNDPGLPRLDNQKPASEVFQTIPGAPAATAAVPGQPAGFPGSQQPAGAPAGGYGLPGGPQQANVPAGGPGMMPQGQPMPQEGVMPAQAVPVGPAGVPTGQPMPQGMPGAGVPVGAPAGNPAGQPVPQGMPWNTPQ